MGKRKLTFFSSGADTFLSDIIANFNKDKEYEVKNFSNGTREEFYHYLHDTDIAWYEWCDQLAVQASNGPKMTKNIIRLHSYEIFTPFPNQVNWGNIEKVIFVSPVIRDIAVAKFKIPIEKTIVISNGIDTSKFSIPKEKKYNKKVAFLGFMNYKKGPQLLVECFNKIHNYDPAFSFHIAGKHQDERIHLWFQHIENSLPFKIHWDGWIDDVSKYLEDKDYIINTSLLESQCLSLMEGMSQGVVPIIYNWIGSGFHYPSNFLFNVSDECLKIIKKFEQSDNKEEVRNGLRKYIIDIYDKDKKHKEIKELIDSI